jgi:hypothetical protein
MDGNMSEGHRSHPEGVVLAKPIISIKRNDVRLGSGSHGKGAIIASKKP